MKKMRKLVLATLALAFGLTACGGGNGGTPAHVHNFVNYSNRISHQEKCDCGEVKSEETHDDNGSGNCKKCGAYVASDCVEYEISEDGTYAIVTGYG